MEMRALGPLEVSVVGLGCNNFGRRVDVDGTRAVVDAALDVGVTFFDTAESYGDGRSEEFLGRALAERRDQVVLATKFGGAPAEGRGSREEIRRALEGSLERLQTDYVDLYQHHREDHATPLAETIETLDELVREGKIRAYGTSNYSPRSSKRRPGSREKRTSPSRASTPGSSATPRRSSSRPAGASASASSPTSRSRAGS